MSGAPKWRDMEDLKRRSYEFELGARVAKALVPMLLKKIGIEPEGDAGHAAQVFNMGTGPMASKLYEAILGDDEAFKVLRPFLPIGEGDSNAVAYKTLYAWCEVQASMVKYKAVMSEANARGCQDGLSAEDEVETLRWLHGNEKGRSFQPVEPIA